MKVLAIEPYFGLSHKSFLEGYQKYSRHEVEIWSLPPRKWKWRMRGSAYHFAERARTLQEETRYDLLLVSDFLNLSDFLTLAPKWFRDVPSVVYFHENQITYPLGKHAPVDYHYGWINLSTALSADRVFFNSYYHRDQFLKSVREVLGQMPDYVPEALLEGLIVNSRVFPVGLDFAEHDAVIESTPRDALTKPQAPTILWNHRWEYDKGPEVFFKALLRLQEEEVPFRLVVCGQSFKHRPKVFDTASRELSSRLVHCGFFPDLESYLKQLRQCDVVVSTAVHEFFGVSVIDAIYCGCLPVLPKRLSYPEIIPPHLHPLFLYESDDCLVDFLKSFLKDLPVDYREVLHQHTAKYDWRHLAGVFDKELESLV